VLGCGNFGGIGSAPELFGEGESREEAFALMDAAWAAGINVFDTAASYGGGRSESWVGAWRREREKPVLLSTKVYWSVTGDPDDRGLGRERILRELDGSLGRLGTERVDLYLTHEPDEETPIEETLRALDEIVRAGKAGAIGASNLDGAGLEEALETSTRLGLARYGWVQNEYSLLRREAEAEILPVCAREGLGFLTRGGSMRHAMGSNVISTTWCRPVYGHDVDIPRRFTTPATRCTFAAKAGCSVIQVDRRMLGEVAGGSAMSDLASIEGLASHPRPQARRAQRMLPESSHR